MAKKNEARVLEMREALLQEQLKLVRQPKAMPSTSQLYQALPFYGDNIFSDMSEWGSGLEDRLTQHQIAAPVHRALRTMVRAPNVDTANACWRAAQEILDGRETLVADIGGNIANYAILTEVYRRTAYYAWSLASGDAGRQVAAIAYELMRRSSIELERVRFLATAMSALETARECYEWIDFAREPEHRASLEALMLLGESAHDTLQAMSDNEVEALESNPRTRIQKMATLSQRIERMAAEAAANIEAEPAVLDEVVDEGPGLVVVPSLAHLPPPSKTNDRGAARFEFGPIENKRLPLIPTPDLPAVAKDLRTRFPWAQDAVTRLCAGLVGRPHATLPDGVILLGAPGCGKNEIARSFGSALGVPVTEYNAGGSADGSFGGTSRQYSTARASVPLQAIRRTGIANPLIVLDEIEKASADRKNGSLLDALLAFAEPKQRKALLDPFLETQVDLSAVSYIATANSVDNLKGPLLDRFVVVRVDSPRREHLDMIVRGILSDMRRESGQDPRWLPDLDGAEMSALRSSAWRGGSIRPLLRAVKRLIALRSSPTLAH